MDRQVIAKICALKERGEPAALVTVVACQGSTPRKPGAAMVVDRAGAIFGSIGGGCGEAEARMLALRALDDGAAGLYRLVLTNAVAADEGMACGGVMEIFIEVV